MKPDPPVEAFGCRPKSPGTYSESLNIEQSVLRVSQKSELSNLGYDSQMGAVLLGELERRHQSAQLVLIIESTHCPCESVE